MWGAVIGGVASLAGSAMSADAAGDAADAQNKSGQAALGLQKSIYDQQQRNLAPYMGYGNAATSKLSLLLGLQDPLGPKGDAFAPTWDLENSDLWHKITDSIYASYGVPQAAQQTGSDAGNPAYIAANIAAKQAFQQQAPAATAENTPGFGSLTNPITKQDIQNEPTYALGLDFGLNEGAKAINNRALASGSYNSGATLKQLARYANDYGTTKANQANTNIMNNRAQQYGFLSGASNQGQSAAAGVNNAGANYANAGTGLLTGMGNATASGIIGGANAYSGLGASLGNLYNGYQNQQLLKSLVGNNGGGGYNEGMSYMLGQL